MNKERNHCIRTLTFWFSLQTCTLHTLAPSFVTQPKVNPNSVMLLTSPKVTTNRKTPPVVKSSKQSTTPRRVVNNNNTPRRTSERRAIASAKSTAGTAGSATPAGIDRTASKNLKSSFLERLARTAEGASKGKVAPISPASKAVAMSSLTSSDSSTALSPSNNADADANKVDTTTVSDANVMISESQANVPNCAAVSPPPIPPISDAGVNGTTTDAHMDESTATTS
jgi:hypothetical protein